MHLALSAGFPPERLLLHGNAKSHAELRTALRHRVGAIVIDNFDELERLRELISAGALEDPAREDAPAEQPVLVRVTPDVAGDTHEKISTGQANSKFGFSMDQAPRALEQAAAVAGLRLLGVHAHIGSQLLELAPFARAAAALASLGEQPVWDLGGGLGVRYTEDQQPPPTIEEYVEAIVAAARAERGRDAPLLIEPGRALCANSTVTLYTVESVKQNVSRWVAVDGGHVRQPAPDALRLPL